MISLRFTLVLSLYAMTTTVSASSHLRQRVLPKVAEDICPATMPSNGSWCNNGQFKKLDGGCEYDTFVCECENGSIQCYDTEEAVVEEEPTCPDEGSFEPGKSECGLPATTTCEYGEESCCGETYPSLVCSCEEGTFQCYFTDACMLPPCEQLEPEREDLPLEDWETSP